MNFVLDNHILILASIYVSIQLYDVYKQYFKVNLDTDNVDLIQRYVSRRQNGPTSN